MKAPINGFADPGLAALFTEKRVAGSNLTREDIITHHESSFKLSVVAKICIGIGVLITLVIVAASVYWYCIRPSQRRPERRQGGVLNGILAPVDDKVSFRH